MYLNLKINNFKQNQKIQKSRSKKICQNIKKTIKLGTIHLTFKLNFTLSCKRNQNFFLTTTNFYSLCRHKKKLSSKKIKVKKKCVLLSNKLKIEKVKNL